jgi:hypothetical protein
VFWDGIVDLLGRGNAAARMRVRIREGMVGEGGAVAAGGRRRVVWVVGRLGEEGVWVI